MPEPTSIRSLITPQDQTLRTVFNAQRSYFIDIYQREYKWDEENVQMLLSDIEVRFSLNPRTKTQPKDIQEHVLDKFEPYFLNTYSDIHDCGKHFDRGRPAAPHHFVAHSDQVLPYSQNGGSHSGKQRKNL